MAKQLKQYRYYADGNANNQPGGAVSTPISFRNLTSGSIFANDMPITQLGIQALPGVKFYLNNSTDPIIIGQTGIYELNLEGIGEITSLKFHPESIKVISENSNAYLIIDILYEKGV